MKEREFEKLKTFYANRALSADKNAEEKYFDFEYPKNLKALSPVVSQMTFQLKMPGVVRLISELGKSTDICNGLCQKRLNSLGKYDLKTLQGAQKFNKKFLALLEGVFGKNMRKLSSVKGLLEDDQFWLIARITNPLRYTTPVTLDDQNISLFAPEQGEYLGPSYLEKFRYEHSVEPILSRTQLAPDELNRSRGLFSNF